MAVVFGCPWIQEWTYLTLVCLTSSHAFAGRGPDEVEGEAVPHHEAEEIAGRGGGGGVHVW